MTMPQSSYIDREVIVLTQEGVWMADGSEITHIPTRKLFARSLRRDSEGYFIEIGRETKRIVVEDTAFFVERIESSQAFLSDGSVEEINPALLSYRAGRLSLKIKNGTEEAKFLRTPYYEILKGLEEEAGSFFLKMDNQRVKLS